MWLPLHNTTSSPIFTYGWIVLSSKTKQFSPIDSPHHVAFELSPYRDGRPGGRFWTVTNLDSDYVFRDPAAQRQYEASLRENGASPAAPPASGAAAERGSFYTYADNAGNVNVIE